MRKLDIKVLINRCYKSGEKIFIADGSYIPQQIFNYFNKSGLGYSVKSDYHSSPEIKNHFDESVLENFVFEGVDIRNDLVSVLRGTLPDHMIYDNSLDAYLLHTSSIDIRLPDMVLGRKSNYKQANYDCLRPWLTTGFSNVRDHTWREGIFAFLKRNDNVPELGGMNDSVQLSATLVDVFMSVFVDKNKFQDRCQEGIRFTVEGVMDWLEKQDASVIDQLESLEGMSRWEIDRYQFMIKRLAKHKLDNVSAGEYAALQTILYHPKYINAFFCVYFRELKQRVVDTLKSNFMIFCDCSPEEFSQRLSNWYSEIISLDKLELDISKYDKSQDDVALMFECQLMERFGFPQYICNMWFDAHCVTKINDRVTGMNVTRCFQRKSGDASTFIGNTLFLMALTASVNPTVKYGVYSGDDSVIWGGNLAAFHPEDLAFLFNLEVKLQNYQYSYFCSKFLLFDDLNCKIRFVPDPLKLLVKLGRRDVRNYEHLKEYHTSFCDHLVSYDNYNTVCKLNYAFIERYDSKVAVFRLINALLRLRDYEEFKELFFVLPGDKHIPDCSGLQW